MSLQTTNRRRRWPLAVLAALIVLFIAGFTAYRFAIRTVEEKIMLAIGPNGEVKELRVGLTAIELRGVCIRAPQSSGKASAWPVEDEFRAERITLIPSLVDLTRLRVVLESIRIEGAYVSMLREKDGRMRVLPSRLETESPTPAPAKPDSAASDPSSAPPLATSTSPATPVTINSIELSNGAIDLFDATVGRTPIKQRLEQIKASVGRISLPDLAGQSAIRLEAIHKGIQRDGKVSIDGSIELATRESGISTVLRDIDMVSLQPYLVKGGDAGVRKGSLDFELNSSIKKGILYAPGSLVLSNLELASSSATVLGIPRKLATGLMKNKKGKITVNFVLTGDINDPAFSLNENLSTRIAESIAGKLGVSIEGLTKGIGDVSGSTAESIGKALGRPKKK